MARNYEWHRSDAPSRHWFTAEQLDGTPDWTVYQRGPRQWFASLRTTAMIDGPFESAAAAKRFAENCFES